MFSFSRDFCARYSCYSVAKLFGPNVRTEVDKGGQIIAPVFVLELLCALSVTFPIMFKLINRSNNRVTHCGVLEFAEESDVCYLPSWMMKSLQLEEGSDVWVQSVKLNPGTYCRIQPLSPDFLSITNPAAASNTHRCS
uniref:Ubiquitin fusion degradation protein UFD1 N-terminal subdomain 1 domain-containing protein n=1 Tax=Gouania willdenowi TaxID=441366 RepID=A0A8C5HXD8_GOUWI